MTNIKLFLLFKSKNEKITTLVLSSFYSKTDYGSKAKCGIMERKAKIALNKLCRIQQNISRNEAT